MGSKAHEFEDIITGIERAKWLTAIAEDMADEMHGDAPVSPDTIRRLSALCAAARETITRGVKELDAFQATMRLDPAEAKGIDRVTDQRRTA